MSSSAITFAERLTQLGACPAAIDWVGDKTARQAWHECCRYDWMLWLAYFLDVDEKVYDRCYLKLWEAGNREASAEQLADIVRKHIPWHLIEEKL